MCARDFVAGKKWLLWSLALVSSLAVIAFLVLSLYNIGWTYSYKNRGTHPKQWWEILLLVLSVGLSLAGIVIHMLLLLSLRLGSTWRRGHNIIIAYLVFQVYMLVRMILLVYVGSSHVASVSSKKMDAFPVVLIVFGLIFSLNSAVCFLLFIPYYRILRKEVREVELREQEEEEAEQGNEHSDAPTRSRKSTETPFEEWEGIIL
uniref:Cytochrome b561 domain-containing protein n=1 Tax=Steinernema glaseri TaxID=37863 RepID=A0A1I8A070_9BILA